MNESDIKSFVSLHLPAADTKGATFPVRSAGLFGSEA